MDSGPAPSGASSDAPIGASGNDDGLCGVLYLRANRLDIVAVGIDQERREIGRAVIGPRAGTPVVAASGLYALAVKFLDGSVIGRAERDVGACTGRAVTQIKPKRRLALGPKTRARVVARAQYVSERRQCCRVEAPAGIEISNFQSDVVVHDDLQQVHVQRRA